jgi:hypothetical protein
LQILHYDYPKSGQGDREMKLSEMKLSEAIRLGSMLKPQSIGITDGVGTCAIGAAAEASGLLAIFPGPYLEMGKLYPILKRQVQDPEISALLAPVMECIWRLNDGWRWSREQIADWVATIEAQHPELCPPVDFQEFDQRVAEPSVPVYEDANEVIA